MKSYRLSKLPCHGCGSTSGRQKDKVCPDCFELMEKGRFYDEIYKELSAKVNEVIEARVPDSWCTPYYSAYRVRSGKDIYNKIEKKIVELARSVSVPKSPGINKWELLRYVESELYRKNIALSKNSVFRKFSGSKEKFEFEQDRIFMKEVYNLLVELDELIREGIRETEKKAVEYGKNTLMMLNNGDITLKEFEEK